MSRYDEEQLAKYLKATDGDMQLVNRAVRRAYAEKRFSPKPEDILRHIEALKAETADA